MKKKIILAFITFLTTFISFGQAPQDVIEYNAFCLKETKPNSAVNLVLGCPKLLITKMLGSPSVINRMQWETVAEDVDEYVYKGNSIYIDVEAKNLWGFEIKNSVYCLNYYGNHIKVGDDIKGVIKKCFPLSFRSKYMNRIIMPLSYKGEYDCTFLYFDYNSNEKITTIGISAYS